METDEVIFIKLKRWLKIDRHCSTNYRMAGTHQDKNRIAPWWSFMGRWERIHCRARGVSVGTWWVALLLVSGCQDRVHLQRQASKHAGAESAWNPVVSVETDWSQLFGSTGASAVRPPVRFLRLFDEPLVEKWRVSVGTGYSSPVIAGSQAIVFMRVSDQEVVRAYDLETGEVRWETRWPTSFECPYEYSDGPASTPLIVGHRVYVLGAEGAIRCLDVDQGEVIWGRDLHEEEDFTVGPFGLGSSPVLADGCVIFQVGNSESHGCLLALDPGDGSAVWSSVDHGASCSTPVVCESAAGRLLVCLTDQGLVSLWAKTGKQIDFYPFRSKIPLQVNATTPMIRDSKIWISAYGLGTAALQLTPDGHWAEQWRSRRSLDSQYNNLILAPQGLMGFSARGHDLKCVAADDGREIWTLECPSGRGNALLSEDQILILGETGVLSLVSVSGERGELLASRPRSILKGRCFSMPAYSQGTLLLKSDEEMVALSLPVAP